MDLSRQVYAKQNKVYDVTDAEMPTLGMMERMRTAETAYDVL
jgi:hypothetical protein